jgi:hypothetical protein
MAPQRGPKAKLLARTYVRLTENGVTLVLTQALHRCHSHSRPAKYKFRLLVRREGGKVEAADKDSAPATIEPQRAGAAVEIDHHVRVLGKQEEVMASCVHLISKIACVPQTETCLEQI